MNDGRNVILEDEASVAAFLNSNGDGRFEQALAGMEFVAFVDPAVLYPYYAEESAVQNRQRVMNEWGLNAYQDMAAQVKLGGEDWLLLLSCGKYGDRWYNLSQIGQLATYLGLSTYVGGLAPYTDIVD